MKNEQAKPLNEQEQKDINGGMSMDNSSMSGMQGGMMDGSMGGNVNSPDNWKFGNVMDSGMSSGMGGAEHEDTESGRTD